MKSESNISKVSLCWDESSRHIAEIYLRSRQIQRPTWKGLYRYWNYAKPTEVEYMAVSHSGIYVVFCITVASGQGGIIAVWNTFRKRWEHVSEASYVTCAILLEDISAIISLHYISAWHIPGHHTIFATQINRTLDGHADITKRVECKYFAKGFIANDKKISQAAYGDFKPNEFGPVGIFLLKDEESIFAHDMGNLYEFSIDSVINALRSNNQQAGLAVTDPNANGHI